VDSIQGVRGWTATPYDCFQKIIKWVMYVIDMGCLLSGGGQQRSLAILYLEPRIDDTPDTPTTYSDFDADFRESVSNRTYFGQIY